VNQQERRRARTVEDGPLQCGAKAPSFSLLDDRGKRLSLSDLEGRWIVLYFYPKDNTAGCTREAIAFRDAGAKLKRARAVVLGVSRDSVDSHSKFKQRHGLEFTLLSDPTTSTHKAYGAYGQKVMYGKKTEGALRTTVLIRPDGTVARVFPKVRVDGHVDAVLTALDEESRRDESSRSRAERT
jgi:thioredoxin-dependent peroxiredoxin